MLEKINELYNQARELGGFKPQPLKQIKAQYQAERYFHEINRATKMGLDVLDFAALESKGYDLWEMSAEEMVEALIKEGDAEDHTQEDINEHNSLISQSL